MRRCLYLFTFLATALCFSGVVAGEVIDSSRSIDWSQAGIPGGIPARATPPCATFSAPTTAAAINSAISTCPANGVVFLNAGTYNLSSGINFGMRSNVTLRGAGADKTFLVFSDDTNCNGPGADVCIAGSNSSPGGENHVATWTAGFARGQTTLTLSNSLGIVAQSTLLNVDQLDELSDTGNIWNCLATGVCSNEGSGGFERRAGGARSQQQQMLVTTCVTPCNVNAPTTVTVSPGLYMPNWNGNKSPNAWWANTYISGSGIEDMSLDHRDSPANAGIMMQNAYRSWVKGVRSLYAGWAHVRVYESSHCVIRDSYFYENRDHLSTSYGAEVSPASSDNLIENNIWHRVTDSTPTNNGGGAGNVAIYNYAWDDAYSGAGWFQASDYEHASGNGFWLREGNQGVGFVADNVHGTHHFTTLFRNHYRGWQSSCGGSACTNQTIPVHLYAGSRYFNVVGNVLGTSGFNHNHYESLAPNGTNGNTSIYTLGWTGNGGSSRASITGFCINAACASHVNYDTLTYDTLMRWGNYDTFTQTIHKDASEVPSSIGLYANPVPPQDLILPASLYHSSKPTWWPCGVAWPPIGPNVTGGDEPGVGGHVFKIPAHRCYDSSSKGVGGVLTFNAATCYVACDATTPAAPSGFRVVL